ncbi:MAG: hypothetical protein IPH31_18270 [Lewinellaceae bacterium]|nr:hypothetical protein [Lewinellaceae bacterium]
MALPSLTIPVNGSDPDGTDGDNNPDEESGTPVSFIQNPVLGGKTQRQN